MIMWRKYILFRHILVSYRFITYIVTSKPNRISCADGVVHIVVLLVNKLHTVALVCIVIVLEKLPKVHSEIH
jgi:hypothetical protein